MKKIGFVIFITAIVNCSSAQYGDSYNDDEVKHHQINLNGSASTWGFLFKIDGKLKWGTDSLSYKGRSSPAIQLAYDYNFNKNMSLGVIGSMQSLGMSVNYLIFKNADDITRRFNNMDISIKRYYIGLRFNYHFINDEKHDLYAGARFGSVFWSLTPSVTDSDLDDRLSAGFPGTMFPSLAFGYKYKIKERVGMGVELSLGIPQLFAYGIDYRF
ncbi:MAG: hypothetical protein ACKVQB_02420 [Bacteroidia bacterium]